MFSYGDAVPVELQSCISSLGFYIDSSINNMIAVIYLFEVFIVV